MTPAEQFRIAELIEKRLNETISSEEFAELESTLLKDPEARRLFLDLNYQHAGLQMLEESLVQEQLRTPQKRSYLYYAAAVAAVALIAVAIFANSRPDYIATLVSCENAAWESSLPTTPGAQLSPGFLKLKSGVATIKFKSGAEVVLEAPAHLVLETPMKAKLIAGSAVIDVPEPAIGFTMETPDGYAVDHGTQFAVSVDKSSRNSAFEVLSGEISVHHPPTGTEVRLQSRQSSRITSTGLESTRGPLSEGTLQPTREHLIRIDTNGRSISVIKNNDRNYLHSDMLMVKKSTAKSDAYNRRSMFAFDLSETNMEKISSARIRLNLVPSGLGFAARLPENNRFAIYGITQFPEKDVTWETAPVSEDGILLGTFQVERSRQTGSYGIETDALLNFLQANRGGQVSFLLVRETPEIKGSGLVHAFASDSHPEASGPVLELK